MAFVLAASCSMSILSHSGCLGQGVSLWNTSMCLYPRQWPFGKISIMTKCFQAGIHGTPCSSFWSTLFILKLWQASENYLCYQNMVIWGWEGENRQKCHMPPKKSLNHAEALDSSNILAREGIKGESFYRSITDLLISAWAAGVVIISLMTDGPW